MLSARGKRLLRRRFSLSHIIHTVDLRVCVVLNWGLAHLIGKLQQPIVRESRLAGNKECLFHYNHLVWAGNFETRVSSPRERRSPLTHSHIHLCSSCVHIYILQTGYSGCLPPARAPSHHHLLAPLFCVGRRSGKNQRICSQMKRRRVIVRLPLTLKRRRYLWKFACAPNGAVTCKMQTCRISTRQKDAHFDQVASTELVITAIFLQSLSQTLFSTLYFLGNKWRKKASGNLS